VLLNASKAYVMQLDKAEEFKLLQPVYALNFVNDKFEKSPEMADEYYHYYKIVNVKNTEKQIEGLEFLFVELPKFKPQNRAERKLYELWLRFLTEVNENTKEIPQELLDNELTREAVGYMEKAAYTKEQLVAYDKWKIAAMTERSAINDALREGKTIGLEEGKTIGLEEGLEIVVINCHKKGYSIEATAEITELTTEQITEILKRNNLIYPPMINKHSQNDKYFL
jgi:predicted transposase/invertase (TIGR01784 family)